MKNDSIFLKTVLISNIKEFYCPKFFDGHAYSRLHDYSVVKSKRKLTINSWDVRVHGIIVGPPVVLWEQKYLKVGNKKHPIALTMIFKIAKNHCRLFKNSFYDLQRHSTFKLDQVENLDKMEFSVWIPGFSGIFVGKIKKKLGYNGIFSTNLMYKKGRIWFW